jgi:hypothetical protein
MQACGGNVHFYKSALIQNDLLLARNNSVIAECHVVDNGEDQPIHDDFFSSEGEDYSLVGSK